ncbi:hypothetical protein D3C72_2163770 [compost metagenome]
MDLRVILNMDKGANPLVDSILNDAGEDKMQTRHPAARDPVFFAVEQILIASAHGMCGHFTSRASGIRLRNTNRRFVTGQNAAGSQSLLLVRPILHDRADCPHIGFN